MAEKILVINTGNTSTKLAYFEDENSLWEEIVRHGDEELAEYNDSDSEKVYREKLVLNFLKDKINLEDLTAIACRGGLLKPLKSGTYEVNDEMIKDLVEAKRGIHASHFSARIGYSLANELKIKAYVVDPVSVDEMEDIARYTGHPLFSRLSMVHSLNLKAIAKKHAKKINKNYEDLRLIVAHLGTGVSLSAHVGGRMVDISNPTEEGPFSIDRTGGLPLLQSVKYVLDENMCYKEFRKEIFGKGGLYAYLKSKDFRKVCDDCHKGDEKSIEVVNAMAYQISKEIGALFVALKGKVDGILLTGGMAYSDFFVDIIKDYCGTLTKIFIYPGEDEMQSLALGTLRVLRGEEEVMIY